MLRNTANHYGMVAIILHWLIALVVVAEFGLGLYMVTLNYYDDLYNMLPQLHESIGILLAVLLVARIFWAILNTTPEAGAGVSHWQHWLSRAVQLAMHGLLIAIVGCGYLWSTANGQPVVVFDWFSVPAIINPIAAQEDIFAFWHYWLAWWVIALAVLHAAAALKHHFIDQDQTLRRMLGRL